MLKKKKVKQVCVRGKGIHAKEGEIMDWVCVRGKRIHAEKEKRRNRYVPEAKEYMRKKKKGEIGMCQRQENTCERG